MELVTTDERPSRVCEGYPPTVPFKSPSNRTKDISFYITSSSSSSTLSSSDSGKNDTSKKNNNHTIHYNNNAVEMEANNPTRLACSLVHYGDDDHPNSNIITDESSPPTPDWITHIDRSRPVIIICHGLLSWRNQMLLYHLAFNLAESLHCHTFRFDFSGNGHSSGYWYYSKYDREAADLRHVIYFARNVMRLRVVAIVGHSKGSTAALRYAWEQENETVKIPRFVNLSGRYLNLTTVDNFLSTKTPSQRDEFLSCGKFSFSVFGRGTFTVTRQDVDERINLSSSPVKNIRSAAVLTIHGTKDEMVPVENARRFAAAVIKSCHKLCLVEGADHNFNGLKYIEELTRVISDFLRPKIRR